MKSELERLREKKQTLRRKRTLRILAISPLIALAFVAVFSLLTRIDTVTVRNGTVYSSSQVAAHLPFAVGDSLFSVNGDKLAAQITASCPYVKSATVTCKLPNALEIDLTPTSVALAIRTETEVLLVDDTFKVLEVTEKIPAEVLYVDGLDSLIYTVGYPLDEKENIQISVVRSLLQELQARDLTKNTAKIDLTKKYNISLQLHGVITVYLGNSEDFEAKMNMLVKILNENDLTVPAEIRVRNPSEGRYSRLDTTDTENGTSSEDTATSDKKDANS